MNEQTYPRIVTDCLGHIAEQLGITIGKATEIILTDYFAREMAARNSYGGQLPKVYNPFMKKTEEGPHLTGQELYETLLARYAAEMFIKEQ